MIPSPPPAASLARLRKHSDYQRVYAAARKQHGREMSFFFAVRPSSGADGRPLRNCAPGTPRVGLTVGKVLGKAHDRNRIKRRLREVVRRHLHLLPGEVDVILHPRRSVLLLPSAALEREVANAFRTVARLAQRSPGQSGGRSRGTGASTPGAAQRGAAQPETDSGARSSGESDVVSRA